MNFLTSFFLNSLSWWQWLLLGIIPPAIIALYFLKLRRQPIEVPSTYLWSRTLEDLHVNSIWQRLRTNLLLFLQLLVVILVMLALLRPGWRGTKLTDKRSIFLIDTSASMQATDVTPSRLERAKQQVEALIDQMKSGDVAMILTSSDFARVEQSYTDNRRLLKQRLKEIRATNRLSDIEEALRYAEGLANPGRSSASQTDVQAAEPMPATLFIFSDGGFSKAPNFFLGNLTPKYMAMGEKSVDNVGILAFSAERNPEKPTQMQAYARLENFTDADATVEVSLLRNGTEIDATQVTIPTRTKDGVGVKGLEFDLNEVEAGVLQLRIDTPDALALDNSAEAVLNPPRPAQVLLVTSGNDSLKLCLTTQEAAKTAEIALAEPGYLKSDEYRQRADGGEYDLVIYDRCVPDKMPQANTFFIGRVPIGEGWKQGPTQGPPFVIDVDRVHPLMQLVELSNVRILNGFAISSPQGARVLIDADTGPILTIAPRGGFEDAALGFEIVSETDGKVEINTNWPIRRSYPVFFMNMLRYLGGGRSVVSLPSIPPGQPISISTDVPVDKIYVRAPDKQFSSALTREQSASFMFTGTEQLGVYEVYENKNEKPTQRFAVNLFNSRESDIRPEEAIKLEHESIDREKGAEPTRHEAWKWILMGVTAVLLLEWYIYNRRVYL